ncbi:TPA: hypothetical protein ACH3X1_010901 [Trebouxia sp. C0004]
MTNTWPDNTVESYFQYKPSLALSLVALVLFFTVATVIAIQTYKYRPRCRFMWIVVFTGGLEVAGYISHIVAAQTVNNSAYVSYLVFTILAPNFLALANYIAVGRVAEQLQLSGRFLNAKSIAAAFFIIDLICIGIQGAGSAILSSSLNDSSSDAASTSGETVVLIGLAIQLFFFSSFTLVAGYVYHLQQRHASKMVPGQVYVCLFVTIALITLRNAYRVTELAAGWSGKYNTNEKYFYCLDALPVFSAFCVYSFLHFGQYLQNTDGTSTGAAKASVVAVVTDSSSSIGRPREKPSSKMDQIKSALTFGLAQKSNSNTAHPTMSELV